jgi:hypothetical protein
MYFFFQKGWKFKDYRWSFLFKKLFYFLNKNIFFQKNASFVFWRMCTEKYIFLILMMRKNNIQGLISIILALLFTYFISLRKYGAF